MKKSSFLHKPKDLLSKSFNPSKCKTALKLATSRIKLLKNKKENQVKQMKRELAQLLESGQDRTARIRVEHVIREEKMMAAYELIEIYCELVVARLTIIETQKNCPIDLKEAVTSVIFASPRCGDIPELLDVRKQFTSKYGKEFTSAAIELRPDCGVSRMLVEKLSAVAPDTQAKIKTLTAIAKEHNIKWDPKSLEENEALPPNDLLNGPASFVKADRPRAEDTYYSTPHVQAPSPPTKLNPSSNLSETNIKSSQGTEYYPASGSNNGSSNYVSSTPQSGVRPSGARPDTAETGQSNHQEGSGYSFDRQNWNMNFKDAASAAKAAAESAEHASMAARAAAQLSIFGNSAKQYSPESEDLSGHSLRGEGTGKHSTSKVGEYYAPTESSNSSRVENELKGRQYSVESQKLHEETTSPSSKFTDGHHPPRDSANSSFAERPPEVHNVRRENVGSANTHRASEKSYGNNVGFDKIVPQTLSSTSKASLDSDPPLTGHQEAEWYSENSLFKGEELGPELTLKNETYKDEPERVNSHKERFIDYDHDIFEEDKITKQSSNIHSSPHSVSGFDDIFVDSGPGKYGSDSSDHHFVNISQDLFDTMAESSSHHDGGVVSFDDYGSDEDFGFPNRSHLNLKDESTLFRPSGRTSPPSLFADTGSGTVGYPASELHKKSESLFPIKQNLFAEFSETSDVVVDGSEQEKIQPVMFDDSDGPSSDNETVMDPQPHNVKDSTDLPGKQYQTLLSASSSFHENHMKNKNQRNETDVQHQEDFGLSKAPVDNSSPGIGKSRRNSGLVGEVETSSSSSITQMDDEDSHNGLNFGKLTGGLRHKGRARFPYQSRQSDDFSTSPKVMAEPVHATENFTNVKKSEIPENERPLRLPSSNLDLDRETSEEVYEKKPSRKSTVKLNVRSPVRYFDSDSSVSEDDDDSAKQGFTGRSSSPFGSGVSRRTKGTPADSTSTGSGVSRKTNPNTPADSASFSSKFQANTYVSLNSGEGRRTSTSSFSGTETPPPSESHVRRSGQFKDLERPSPARKGSNMESNVSANIENKKPSAAAVQTRTSEQKVEPSSGGNVITREGSGKKPSHVHPKLPDYDTIASRLQPHRTNRQ